MEKNIFHSTAMPKGNIRQMLFLFHVYLMYIDDHRFSIALFTSAQLSSTALRLQPPEESSVALNLETSDLEGSPDAIEYAIDHRSSR